MSAAAEGTAAATAAHGGEDVSRPWSSLLGGGVAGAAACGTVCCSDCRSGRHDVEEAAACQVALCKEGEELRRLSSTMVAKGEKNENKDIEFALARFSRFKKNAAMKLKQPKRLWEEEHGAVRRGGKRERSP